MIYMLFHPRSQLLVKNRYRVQCSGKPCIALTFDDGPSEKNTEEILKILKLNNVKATFFIIGNRAEKYPDQIRKILEEHHQIANHTYSHPNLFCFLSPGRLRREIERCSQVIEKFTNTKPLFFRSPVGLRHPLLSYYLNRSAMEYISWCQRAFDTFTQSPQRLKERILKRIRSGDIIVLHDGSNPNVRNLLAMLPDLIDELKKRGYEFVLV